MLGADGIGDGDSGIESKSVDTGSSKGAPQSDAVLCLHCRTNKPGMRRYMCILTLPLAVILSATASWWYV